MKVLVIKKYLVKLDIEFIEFLKDYIILNLNMDYVKKIQLDY
jgi:hypothetical protein